MAFDQKTRNLLQRTVSACRNLLDAEFAAQRRSIFAINDDGTAAPLETLGHLSDEDMQTAKLLRDRLDHLVAGLVSQGKKEAEARKEAVARVTREQAFTVLNRLAALRMSEEREIVLECVRQGTASEGFQLFMQTAGGALGTIFESYRCYLFLLFDELAIDLGVLFSRWDPAGLLFPRQEALEAVLRELNGTGTAATREDITPEAFNAIWAEDETIGWIYQYYNDPTERKKMREESSAPRNSRELAVRNQFFTPRYVVEFLTDNTLGRIWYEMTQGETKLKEQCRYLVRRPNETFLKPGESAPEQPKQDNLAQEDLLKQPVFIPHRPLKDPRTILMLDPACGSMHFGLYAFDLFEVIYDEAWALEEKLGADALSRPPGMKSLHDTYAGKDAFLKDVPRLIIEHNLHGIDIDPRCAQIAGLSLWLRAQKAWQRLGLKPAERPAIKRSNIVCAEPMPGEKELVREFVEREFPAAERAVCLRLLEAIFDKMQLAGEAGSLLKIEEEIRNAIEEARDAWQKLATKPQELFTTTELNQLSTAPELTGLEQAVSSLTIDPRHLTTDFWERIEERIYAALRDYAEQAENGGGFQRRLFAEDAARGFAFIDVCRKRYDVALMNPPFGNPTVASRKYLSSEYPKLWADVYAAFIERGLGLLSPSGRIGAITSRTFLALSSFETLRELLLDVAPIQLVAECGLGVLDGATVRAAFFVAEHSSRDTSRVSFWDLRRAEDRGAVLHDAIRNEGGQPSGYLVSRQTLRKVPGKPFTYWLPERLLRLLAEGPHIDHTRVVSEHTRSLAEVTVGASTTDDPRFVRCHWEVSPASIGPNQWTRFAHAAGFCRFYAPSYAVLNWNGDGKQLLAIVDDAGNIKPRLRCQQHFLTSGLVSPYISERGLGCSYLPEDHIVSNSCRAYFRIEGPQEALLAYLNSSFIDLMLWALTPDRKHEAGIIAALPVPIHFTSHVDALTTIGRQSWEQMIVLRSVDECDPYHWLSLPELSWKLRAAADELKLLQQRLDEIVAVMVSEEAAFLHDISQIAGAPHDLGEWLQSSDAEDPDGASEQSIPLDLFLARTKVSFALGIAFGRWDIRYATGEQAAPELPDPFAPLPVCPPGQLQNAQGLPARPEDVPAAYPVRIPWDGILVDDPNHPLDLERRVREVIEIIWSGKDGGPTAEAIEHEACEILGVKSLRDYFRKPTGFFADHLKRYSKSRRQAPIYWPLSTASGSYTLWIYYHRLTPDTLYKCLQQFVEPKIKDVEQDIHRLRTMLSSDEGGSKERKQLEDAETLLNELKEMHAELSLWAPKWKPNLNDGVLITASPLWKLFRFPKWRKDLEACWKELEKGDYDWAHLAHTLWPTRVREKSKKDRSLAIAHGLEELCEIKAPEPKKKAAKKAAGKKDSKKAAVNLDLDLEGGSN